ncbi:MAG: hypothetical protein CVU39_03845 [Chloroflexi bacterium HGW-Chloroflexi-10]|nr:MAG: hypothetical protein CVU39_03845 [Chloroflexi bacterium HGW-Chloroflexi-10]
MKKKLLLGYVVVCLLLITSCNGEDSPAESSDVSVNENIQAIQVSQTPFLPQSTAIMMPDTLSVWIPQEIQALILEENPFLAEYLSDNPNVATCKFTESTPTVMLGQIVFALTVPFNTIRDEISKDQLDLMLTAADASGSIIGASVETVNLLEQLGLSTTAIKVVEENALIEQVYAQQESFAIIPFDQLSPAWKVLRINGISPYDQEFSYQGYPLSFQFGLQCENNAQIDKLNGLINSQWNNRDPEKFTSILLTGTTALTRATAGKMEVNGNSYPGEKVYHWFQAADITHISNEVSFNSSCPAANPNQKDLFFCSRPEYAELFAFLGVDVVELTGNHLVDKGVPALEETFDLLSEMGIPYYAAGRTQAEAEQAVLFENNGNRIAFLGCNEAGPNFVWISEGRSGVNKCDMDKMADLVRGLREEGYLPVVTFQYGETFQFKAMPNQRDDSRQMIDAGAVIVSGSQAHLPMTMDVYYDGFIHYGLGNLFFDQMDIPVTGTRREFLDRHIFYNGKYLGVDLLTAMLEDYAQPRPMTAEERENLLQDAFADFSLIVE